MAAVDHLATGPSGLIQVAGADQEFGDFVDRLLRGGEADALQGMRHERGQPFHGEGQMRAAPVADDSMNLIDDEGAHGGQHFSPGDRS